jgi:DNA-binding HxlR family transcriptional regulator
MKKSVDTQCRAFQSAIELLSRPWNGLILGMLQHGPLRFSELEERSHGLGPKTLSSRLKVLEARGIVARRIESGPPVRVHYALSAKGRAFGKVAEAIHHWGSELVADEALSNSPPRTSRGRRGRKTPFVS